MIIGSLKKAQLQNAAATQFQRAAAIRQALAQRAPLQAGGVGLSRVRRGGMGFGPPAGFGALGMGGGGDEEESPTRRPPSRFGLDLGDDDFLGFAGLRGLGPRFGMPFGRSRAYGGWPGYGRGLGFGPGSSFGIGRSSDPAAMVRQPTHPWSVRERAWLMLRRERRLGPGGAGADDRFFSYLEHSARGDARRVVD